MSDAYVGEIRMFGGNFAPRGWALCDGQLLAVSSNDALFSLLGTIYGGDGRTTFGLPDLRSRVPIHAGSGPGLSSRKLGSKGGTEKVTLTASQIGSHNHPPSATSDTGDSSSPQSRAWAASAVNTDGGYTSGNPDFAQGKVSAGVVGNAAGGGGSHENRMPTQCINFIIALFGIYPSRN